MLRRITFVSLLTITGLVLAGCYRPQGGLLSYTGEAATFHSTETKPVTIKIIDLRSDEEVFAMDVPPGKQLTMKFHNGDGDDPVYTPDLMKYDVFDIGTKMGPLGRAMTVPNAASRRVDVYYRRGPEYATVPGDQRIRADQLSDRPEWWTPEGGEYPTDYSAVDNYDD